MGQREERWDKEQWQKNADLGRVWQNKVQNKKGNFEAIREGYFSQSEQY